MQFHLHSSHIPGRRRYAFSPETEDYLVHITTGSHVAQICLFLLTESHYFPTRLLQTSPPERSKPGPGPYRIIDLDLSRYDSAPAARVRPPRAMSTLPMPPAVASG